MIKTWFDGSVRLVEQRHAVCLQNGRITVEISKRRGEWTSLCADGYELLNYKMAPTVPVDFKVEGHWTIEEHGCEYLEHEVALDDGHVTLIIHLGVKEYPYTTALYANMVPPGLIRDNPQILAGHGRGRRYEYIVSCLYSLAPGDPTLRRRIRVRRNPEMDFSSPKVLKFESFLFKLPGIILGDEEACTVDMPGPIVPSMALRPRLPYVEAKQLYITRRPAPDFDLGIVVLSNERAHYSLGLWHETTKTTYVPHIIGNGASITIAVNEEYGDYILDTCDFLSHESVLRCDQGPISSRLHEYSHYITQVAPPMTEVPLWVKDAVIAELTPRRYPTFRGSAQELPRLKDAGFNTIWLMPLGEGGYAFADHYQIRPELGTPEDLKMMVQEAHRLGIRVLLDLVTGYMSPASRLLREHPEYFLRDEAGRIMPHVRWDNTSTDNADEGFQRYVVDFATYCVREYDVDGFRCDDPAAKGANWYPHTGRAPWETTMAAHRLLGEVNRAIKQIKPEAILMDELSGPIFFQVCDICCHLSFALQLFAQEAIESGYTVSDYKNLLSDQQDVVPGGARYVWYMGNHDTFLWLYAKLAQCFCERGYPPEYFCYEAIHALVRAIPLVCFDTHSPRELPPILAQRLGTADVMEFYKRLYGLRRENRVLIDGGCHYRAIETDDRRVFSAIRTLGEETVIVLVSTAQEPIETEVTVAEDKGEISLPLGPCVLLDLLRGKRQTVRSLKSFRIQLDPYDICVFRVLAGQGND